MRTWLPKLDLWSVLLVLVIAVLILFFTLDLSSPWLQSRAVTPKARDAPRSEQVRLTAR
jgi:hypothetical protein